MPEIKLPSATVHYLEQGCGAPVLLLHANPGDSRDFEAVIPQLASSHRVIALDWPGYGRSAMPEQPESRGPRWFCGVLLEFLEALQLPPAILVGNSLGGNAAARLAAEHPARVKALVLVAPGGFTPHNFVTRAFCRLQGSALAMSPRLWAGLYLRKRSPAARAMLARAAQEQATAPRLALNRALWRGFGSAENDLRDLARAVKAPVLLLFGQHDPAIPPGKDGREARRAMPHAQMQVLPCGHASFAEMPDAFLAAAAPFLAANAA